MSVGRPPCSAFWLVQCPEKSREPVMCLVPIVSACLYLHNLCHLYSTKTVVRLSAATENLASYSRAHSQQLLAAFDTPSGCVAAIGGVEATGMAAAMRVESLSALPTQTGPAAQCASTMTPTRATAFTPKTARTIDPQPHYPCPWSVSERVLGAGVLPKGPFQFRRTFASSGVKASMPEAVLTDVTN